MWSVIAYWTSGEKTVSTKVYKTKKEAQQAEKWLYQNFPYSLWKSQVVPLGYKYK